MDYQPGDIVTWLREGGEFLRFHVTDTDVYICGSVVESSPAAKEKRFVCGCPVSFKLDALDLKLHFRPEEQTRYNRAEVV